MARRAKLGRFVGWKCVIHEPAYFFAEELNIAATIKDVARQSGLSIATISKVYKEDPVDDLDEDGENQVTLLDATEKE